MPSNPEDLSAPPPYSESGAPHTISGPSQPRASSQLISSTDAKLTVKKADEVHIVARRWHIFNDPSSLLEHREMYVEEERSKLKTHSVEFKSGNAPAMYIHRGDNLGPIIGQVSFVGNGPSIELVFPDGENVKIEDIDPTTTRIPIKLLVNGVHRLFYWARTEEYVHENVGKSSVGDIELADETGKIYAVFLNEWRGSGSKEKKRVGQLDVLESGVEDRLIDQWIVTLLALIERYVVVSSHKFGKFAAGTAAAAAAFCVVS
jgi:hypothetical protein